MRDWVIGWGNRAKTKLGKQKAEIGGLDRQQPEAHEIFNRSFRTASPCGRPSAASGPGPAQICRLRRASTEYGRKMKDGAGKHEGKVRTLPHWSQRRKF